MNLRRPAYAAAGIGFAALALASLGRWHAFGLVPMAAYAAVVCAFAIVERGRYRRSFRGGTATWRPTGERFFDPVTGAPTDVFYDPITGARDYRTR